MPKPLPAELKMAVQTMVLQGFTSDVIAQQLGVNAGSVATWSHRHGWKAAVNKVKATAVTATESVAATTLAKTNEYVRESLAGSIAHVATKLSERRPKSLKAAMAQQAKLEATVRNAKAVFGWREGEGQSPVRISVMAHAVQVNTGQPGQSPSGVQGEASPAQQQGEAKGEGK